MDLVSAELVLGDGGVTLIAGGVSNTVKWLMVSTVGEEAIPGKPVLFVDDFTDGRKTLKES